MSLEIFSYNLKLIRRQMEISQEDAALMIGVGRSNLGAWEEGRCYPTVETFVKLCDAYGMTDIYSLVTKKIDTVNGVAHFGVHSSTKIPPKVRVQINRIKKIVNAL